GLLVAGAGGLMHHSASARPTADRTAVESARTDTPEVSNRGALTTGEGKTSFKQDSSVRSVAVSPDGKLLAAKGSDGQIQVWLTATGDSVCQIQAFDFSTPLAKTRSRHGHPLDSLSCVQFLDNRVLAGWGMDFTAQSVELFLWDAITGRVVDRLQAE